MKGKRIITALLVLSLAVGMMAMSVSAAEDTGTPRYLITGTYRSGVYTLDIRISGVFAWTGRIALRFNADTVALVGADDLSAFRMAQGVSAAQEGLQEQELVSGEKGFARLAWYASYGIDARTEPQSVATIQFRVKGDSSRVDGATFHLDCLEPDDLGSWTSGAGINGRGDVVPVVYEYLTEQRDLDVEFTYPGSDRELLDGKAVTFWCKSIMDAVLPNVEITVNGQTCTTNSEGIAQVMLSPGEYIYRARKAGYGDVRGRITVTEASKIDVTMTSDADLVEQARQQLEITFQPGDSEKHVTGPIQLPFQLNGTQITWTSSAPEIITREGLVYLPADRGREVTLTAQIARGTAGTEKSFTVYVCSQAELNPDVISVPGRFRDLGAYAWARAAIEELAARGIISGTTDTTFSPGESIRRGDFVALLMRMLGTGAPAETAFSDVPANSYYFKEIAQARSLGIAAGTGEDRFHPDAPITRQEMITFVMRAMEQTGYIQVGSRRDDLRGFQDAALVADYARESVSAAVANGLIVGADGRLNPQMNTTRAEAAVFLHGVLKAHGV